MVRGDGIGEGEEVKDVVFVPSFTNLDEMGWDRQFETDI